MAVTRTLIHAGGNDDRWFLCAGSVRGEPRPEMHGSPVREAPEAVIERWHRVLAMIADNDNAKATGRGRFVAAVLTLPLFVMTTLVGCVRFLS